MNQLNMPGMNPSMPGMGNMPMNNLPNGAMPRQMDDEETMETNEAKLNHWIYAYFLDKQQWDAARSLKNGSLRFEPPLGNADEEMNGVNEDSKSNINDSKRPADLPSARGGHEGGSLLPSWFNLFWDMFDAQRGGKAASAGARQVIDHNRNQRTARDQQMYRAMNGMMPTPIDPNMQQMLRMNGMNGDHLRQKAMQNQQQSGFRGMNPQMVANMQRTAMMQQQQSMRRDPSVDMNGQRPRTPSSGDHAPSPKRPRMDVANGFNPQMMQNGRPPPGMPPQMMGEAANQTNAMLLSGGVNPGNLSESQYASFQQQNPAVQQKSIQVFAQNMSKSSREDAMNMALGPNPDFFPNGARPMPGHMGANAGANGAGGNHALQDYQMQLMLLEQQNKKRLLMARQEQEGPPQPGMPPYAPGMSPSGSRGGPSPGPGERRGTPKIGQGGSPLPEGSLRGSPAAMNAFNPMPPEMYPQMNGGMRPPPNGTSNFAGQFTTQQMEQLRAVNPQQGRMPNGNWPQGVQGPQGQPPMNQQQASQPQPAQIGTPQPRNNDMPPPQGPPPGAVNGRPGADDAPPTPQQNPKPNPKKKNAEKKKPTKKNSTSVAATPASEAENAAATPTPATPVTPAHRDSFASKAEGLQAIPAPVANDTTAMQIAAAPADLNSAAQFNASGDGSDGNWNNELTDSNMNTDNLLDSFNFEEFLDPGALSYDFGSAEISEPMMDAA